MRDDTRPTSEREHPITPPPPPYDLVKLWVSQWIGADTTLASYIATRAAQWGWVQRGEATEAELQQRADQELEACCEWISGWYGSGCGELINGLRAARRPTPPSDADIALADLDALVADLSNHGMGFKTTNLRHALERLKELEAAQ